MIQLQRCMCHVTSDARPHEQQLTQAPLWMTCEYCRIGEFGCVCADCKGCDGVGDDDGCAVRGQLLCVMLGQHDDGCEVVAHLGQGVSLSI